MKANWIPTRDYYHEIINAPDLPAREAAYDRLFMQPWAQMMQMFAGENASGDKFAGARAWKWLLPDQLSEAPDSLQKLEGARAWEVGQKAMEDAIARFEPYAAQIGMDTITGWLVLGDPALSDPKIGYTGATDWMQPRFVVQYDTPNDYNLPRIATTIAHEMHHLIRFRIVPFNPMTTTVAEYMLAEGLAESFATSLYGEELVGYFVSELDDFDSAKRIIGAGLEKTGFDVIRSYIFGDQMSGMQSDLGMPAYGGYAIGYHVVQAFLKETGKSIEEATFLSADEIIRESKFFV